MNPDLPQPDSSSLFPQTRWSVVLEAQGKSETAVLRALGELCQTYWYPLYVYARRRGLSPHDAEDLIQSFFESLLERGSFNRLTPEKGRLRAFLLTALKHKLSSLRSHDRAKKRGGGLAQLSIDVAGAESRFARELAVDDPPERAFERSWAHALLETVYGNIECHYGASGQAAVFARLRQFLAWGEGSISYQEAAADLGMGEGAVRTAVHRMRGRFRALIEAEIRETVTTAGEAAEELGHLKRILSGS